MLVELRVRDLGVIEDLSLVFSDGLTAVTGETGAGKTLVVEALTLLAGARADPGVVRAGATEAVVEGRFEREDGEVVLSRVISSAGRSRAYVDGNMVTASALAELARPLLDLHGQHGHQQLLSAASQRALLDDFAGVDLTPMLAVHTSQREVEDALAAMGGDAHARAREVDLLRHQVNEIDDAAIRDPDEDAALESTEDRLADAAGHREAALAARDAVTRDGGALDLLKTAAAALAGRSPFGALRDRLRGLDADLSDVADELRVAAEALEDDPEQLEAVRARRQLLGDLRRKYGTTLTEVREFRDRAHESLTALESHEQRAAALEAQRADRQADLARAQAAVGAARRAAAPALGREVEGIVRGLAMAGARFEVAVGDQDPGDDVEFRLSANPGEPVGPLARLASGGELARVMLAVRLVSVRSRRAPAGSAAASTLVFDEVDAGIGGEAALAVGGALAALAPAHQVLVVTHLPQVAAFADHQVAVRKGVAGARTVATAEVVDGAERVVELSRMLSGQPDSARARSHAKELLATAAAHRRSGQS